MDTVFLILKIALAVGCAVGVYYLAIYVAGFWYIIEGVCLFLQMITERLTCPPRKLFRLLKIKLLPAATDSVASKLKRGPIARFAERYPVFGTVALECGNLLCRLWLCYGQVLVFCRYVMVGTRCYLRRAEHSDTAFT